MICSYEILIWIILISLQVHEATWQDTAPSPRQPRNKPMMVRGVELARWFDSQFWATAELYPIQPALLHLRQSFLISSRSSVSASIIPHHLRGTLPETCSCLCRVPQKTGVLSCYSRPCLDSFSSRRALIGTSVQRWAARSRLFQGRSTWFSSDLQRNTRVFQ